MRKPRQNVIVDGIDLFDRYGLVLTDDSTYEPPEPKTYVIDVPGGNGSIDVTESVFGDVAYSDRMMELVFLLPYPGGSWESAKTDVASFLHGRAHDFVLTNDPGYTYHGRFSITSWERGLQWATITMSVRCDPYKVAQTTVLQADASAGVMMSIDNGRRMVSPTVRVATRTEITAGDATVTLEPGTWSVSDLWLPQGTSQLWALSRPDGSDTSLYELRSNRLYNYRDTRLCLMYWHSALGSNDIDIAFARQEL